MRRLRSAVLVVSISCGGDLVPVDGGPVVTTTPPFCGSAGPSEACATTTCASQLVHDCQSNPSISTCACKLADGWQTCGSSADPCPAGTECRALAFASCLGIGFCNGSVDVCWPGPPCSALTDAETCRAGGCRWLVPGCPQGELPTVPAPTCYPIADCTPSNPTACTGSSTCTQVTYAYPNEDTCTSTMVARVCVAP